ncbi:MAG: hypothetical protein KIT57_05910 [Blastocatellales bacterium]|nr:hypothetical protein [Blastocatellales bacterium]
MRRIVLFVEDFGHETFLKALVWRLAAQHQISIIGPETFSARGGRGAVLSELGQFAHDLRRGLIRLPDLLLVAIDGNCKGHLQRRQEIEHKTDGVAAILGLP